MKFEYIDEAEVEVVKRGRKSQVPQELVEAIREIPANKVVKLTELAGDPTDENYKNYKASTASMIRQAGKLAGFEVRTNWSPNGIPQVKKILTASKKRKG